MFKDFGRKLQRDVKRQVDARLKLSEELSQGRIKVRIVLSAVRDTNIFHYSLSIKPNCLTNILCDVQFFTWIKLVLLILWVKIYTRMCAKSKPLVNWEKMNGLVLVVNI